MEFPLRSGAKGGDVQQENGILGGGFHNFKKPECPEGGIFRTQKHMLWDKV